MDIQAYNPSGYKLMHDGILALGRAESVGFHIDVDYCEKMMKHLTRQIDSLERQFKETDLGRAWHKIARRRYSMDNNHQLADAVYNEMGVTPLEGEGRTTKEVVLRALEIDGTDEIIQMRKLKKARDTYLGAFVREQVGGVLRPFYNLHIPRTFRSSSDSPNFQNIPNRDPEIKKLVRRAVKARPGHQLLCADYSGVEVRIAYCYHKDPTMHDYLEDPLKDMHRDMAAECYKLDTALWTKTTDKEAQKRLKQIRHSGKNEFVFPEFYGDWYSSCAKAMYESAHKHVLPDGTPLLDHMAAVGIGSLKRFEQHLKKVEDNFWNKRFPVYTKWKEKWLAEYHRKGYFDMYTGFRCTGLMDRNDVINYPVQGAAFHCLLLAFILIDKIQDEEGWRSRLIGQIHDELIVDVHPDEREHVLATVHDVMVNRVPEVFKWICITLDVEGDLAPIDGTWYDKETVPMVA